MEKSKKVPEAVKIQGVLENDIKALMTPQAIKDLAALNPTVQQFLLRFIDQRDVILSNQIKDELFNSVSKVLEPWHDKLDLIISNQDDHGKDLNYLKDVAKENRVRIETLENVVEVHNKVLEGHNAVLKKSLRINKWIEIVVWTTLVISILTALFLTFHIV